MNRTLSQRVLMYILDRRNFRPYSAVNNPSLHCDINSTPNSNVSDFDSGSTQRRYRFMRRLLKLYDFSSKDKLLIRRALTDHNTLDESPVIALRRLKELGFSKEDVVQNTKVLTLSVPEISRRIDYFKEGGATIDFRIITRFHSLAGKSVSTLKAAKIIPENTNVQQTIHFNAGSNLYENYMLADELSSFKEVHWKATFFFLQSYFGETISPNSPSKIGKFVPLTHIVKIITLLTKEVNIPDEWIVDHFDILNADPDNLSRMLTHGEYPLDIDIVQLLQTNPKIATFDLSNMLNVLNLFKDAHVSKDDVIRHSNLLKESSPCINEKLNSYRKLGELSHIKPLDAIHIPNFSNKALSLLSGDDCKHTELDRFLSDTQRSMSRNVPKFLANELEMDVKLVTTALKQHPNWTLSKFSTVRGTLKLLRSYGYTNEELKNCIPLLLYPRFNVQRTLEWLFEKEALQNFELRERHLPLCLYYIEKQNLFTWDVMQEDENDVKDEI